jgi:hypothetical protein
MQEAIQGKGALHLLLLQVVSSAWKHLRQVAGREAISWSQVRLQSSTLVKQSLVQGAKVS